MRTQIIATIGPKSSSPEVLQSLIRAGMNIARINFSHCSGSDYKKYRDAILSAGKAVGKKVRILQDLQGPRIRVGVMPPDGRKLVDGEDVVFSTEKKHKPGEIFVDDKNLHKDIKKGDPLYLTNGELELIVTGIAGKKIKTKVIRGGVLFSRKAVNVPNTKLTATGPTDKDLVDVEAALSAGVDFVAVSFVQTAKDIEKLRKVVGNRAQIIAKIETALALKHINEIICASDGIMIARGDLGIEIPIEQLPYTQKHLIRHATWHGKPTITATQMLQSMVSSARPTRAEVSDVANAVWDGTDAVMLSDETASGHYPVESLETMVRIVKKAEEHLHRSNFIL